MQWQTVGDAAPPTYQSLPPGVFTNDSAAAIEVVVVSDEVPELAALIVPVLARLTHSNDVPELIVAPVMAARREPFGGLLKALSPAAMVLVHAGEAPNIPEAERAPCTYAHQVPTDIAEASIEMASRYWGSVETAVIADAIDPESIVLGSALAAHKRVPLLLRNRHVDSRIAAVLRGKGVRSVYRLDPFPRQGRFERLPMPEEVSTRVLDAPAANAAIVETIGRKRIRNIVLARVPESRQGIDQAASSWLAPYVSLVRLTPIMLVPGPDAGDAEAATRAFVETHELRLRSVTILADDHSIGLQRLALDMFMDVETEPFCVPGQGGAIPYAVGRIPFPALSDASLMLARGFTRKKLLATNEVNRALMVANPSPEVGNLPLCETVSRATSLELQNSRIQVQEFYRVPADDPKIREASRNAHLIIYEGHLGDQRLFDDPEFFLEGEYYAEWEDFGPGAAYLSGMLHDVEYDGPPPLDDADGFGPEWGGAAMPPPSDEPMHTGPFAQLQQEDLPHDVDLLHTNRFFLIHAEQVKDRRLDGMPVVVLQSCKSLDEFAFVRLTEMGCVALIGSGGNIHSASGSTFIKSVIDNMLYRRSTIGEALRDARNYFFCLQDLKDSRRHREQAKSSRVAFSFRLWGDPELRVFPRKLRNPRRRPAVAEWTSSAELRVVLPRRKLAKVTTEKYVMHNFPGSQAAGLVKKLKNTPARGIKAIHCFRVDVPKGFRRHGFTRVRRAHEENRAAFRVDPLRRFVYVIHFPRKEVVDEDYVLRFTSE